MPFFLESRENATRKTLSNLDSLDLCGCRLGMNETCQCDIAVCTGADGSGRSPATVRRGRDPAAPGATRPGDECAAALMGSWRVQRNRVTDLSARRSVIERLTQSISRRSACSTRFAFYLADRPRSDMIADLWLFGNMFFSCPTVQCKYSCINIFI